MNFAEKQMKSLKEKIDKEYAIYKEGEEAYYKMLCTYYCAMNPYKDCTSPWNAYNWMRGYQHAQYENNKPNLDGYVKETDTTYNFRNEGESTGIDRYFGRGL